MKLTKITYVMITFILLVITTTCFSQKTFEFTIKDTVTDQIINDAVELSNGSFILVGQEVYPNSHSKAHLYRISDSGKLLDSITLTYQGAGSAFIKIVQTEPNLFTFAGYTFINNKGVLWVYQSDSLFNEVRSTIIPLGTYDLFAVSGLLFHNNNFLFTGTVQAGLAPYPFIYKLSPDFDSLQLRIFTDHTSLYPIDLLVKNNNTGYYCFTSGYGTPKTQVMVDLDTLFSIKNIYGVSNDIFNFNESRWISATSMIYCGRYAPAIPSQIWSIAALRLDTLANTMDDLYIGDNDTNECPGLRSRIDFIDTNNIFIGGTHNFYQYSEFGRVNCWFSLTRTDTALNFHWEHFYGGDCNYTMYGIKATRDNGCLMFGSRYDFPGTSSLERDICVYKTDQDGLITGNDHNPDPNVHNAVVFPNPGNNFMMVKTACQFPGAKIFILNMNGNQIFNEIINDSHLAIDTQPFSSGVYFWKIIFKNKVIESGKWIKQSGPDEMY